MNVIIIISIVGLMISTTAIALPSPPEKTLIQVPDGGLPEISPVIPPLDEEDGPPSVSDDDCSTEEGEPEDSMVILPREKTEVKFPEGGLPEIEPQ